MKCLKLVFSSDGQKEKNIGSYMITDIFVLFIALTVIYFITGQKNIKEIINGIAEKKKFGDEQNIKGEKIKIKKEKENKKIKTKKKKRKIRIKKLKKKR